MKAAGTRERNTDSNILLQLEYFYFKVHSTDDTDYFHSGRVLNAGCLPVVDYFTEYAFTEVKDPNTWSRTEWCEDVWMSTS